MDAIAAWSKDSIVDVKVCSRRVYTPVAQDVGCTLKFECKMMDGAGKICGEMVSALTETVEPCSSPPLRAMIPVHPCFMGSCHEGRFKVLTYNILADFYAMVRLVSQASTS